MYDKYFYILTIKKYKDEIYDEQWEEMKKAPDTYADNHFDI